MLLVELSIFALVFGAICFAYTMGRDEGRPAFWQPQLRLIQRYSPPIEMVLEYCDERGAKTVRRLRVIKTLARRDGRLYLFGACQKSRELRTFRVDRIISVATIHGEVVDTTRFLVERLRIPSELCVASVAAQSPSRHLLAGSAHS